MSIKKLATATILICFGSTLVFAGGLSLGFSKNGVATDLLVPTVSCQRGYKKSSKTGNCVRLVCGKNQKLGKGGHKCLTKPKGKKGIVAQNGDGSI